MFPFVTCLLIISSLFAPSFGLVLRSDGDTGSKYFWPTIHGSDGAAGASPFSVPEQTLSNLGKPAWTWQDERGFWSNIPISTLIDDKKNIVLTLADGITKFNPDGEIIWKYKRSIPSEEIHQGSSLWKGNVFTVSTQGRAFAVDLGTGKEVWSTKYARDGDGNYGNAAVHEGIMIAGGEASEDLNRKVKSCCGAAAHVLAGLNATDGRILWTYRPEIPVWASNPSFAKDGTFIFQNLEGTVYRNRLDDGSVVWKAGGQPGTWTDGSATLGPNGIVYAPSNTKNGGPNIGFLSAYRLSDGQLLWKKEVPRPPNQAPAIGRLTGKSGLSVVQPMGMQCSDFQRMDVQAFDAETGELQWVFEGPRLVHGGMVAGDIEGYTARKKSGIQTLTMPHPFSPAAIDANGTVFVGVETGEFLALRDLNHDGHISGAEEAYRIPTKAAYVGSSGPAIAPGMLALGTLNQLFVWKFPE